jgi:4-amino-4-deoxy-L-arabinose transferase-like glycosyltransferase
MAFSAVNVHYSRMALSNITTPFFWAVCFFFLTRGLRSRKPADWTLAGLAAGISEHFYYGTRLLPFILVSFVVYLLVFHWLEAKRYVTQLGWLALGYLIGFGPLLSYFLTHPGLYYGRGVGLMTWNRIPVTWHDLQKMLNTLWPIMSENLLGISTHSAQDIMYFAPLLLAAEAALLVLGVAVLVWRWRHPAAFYCCYLGLECSWLAACWCCIRIAPRRCRRIGRQRSQLSTRQLRCRLEHGLDLRRLGCPDDGDG